jgi:hypothetical protein
MTTHPSVQHATTDAAYAASPSEELDKLLAREIPREFPTWDYWHYGSVNFGFMQQLDIRLSSGERRIEITIDIYNDARTPSAHLKSWRGRQPQVAWTSVADVGEDAIAFDECERAWMLFTRGPTFVTLACRRNVQLPVKTEHWRPGVGCAGGSNRFSQELRDAAREIGRSIDQHVAAQLAVAPEPAQRSSIVILSTVARAR